MNTQLATVERPRREVVQSPVEVMDTARFEHMQRIASIMANGSLVPQALTHLPKKGNVEPAELPFERVLANCFLVVNQAVRWGMDPFAVAQCVSVVHGRLMYEGKLVAAVIEAKIGVKFDYKFGAWDKVLQVTDLSKEGAGDDLAVRVTEILPDGTLGTRFVDGYVGGWKTTGTNTPWAPQNHRRQLRYRGAREWSRAYEPGLMLGVYTEDEMENLYEDARFRNAHPVGSGLASRLASPSIADEGFSTHEQVSRELESATAGRSPTASPAATSTGGTSTSVEQPEQAGAEIQEKQKSEADNAGVRNGPDAGGPSSAEAGTASAASSGAETDRTPSGDPPQGDAATTGGSAAGGSPLNFKGYSDELLKATQQKSLKAFSDAFRLKNAWTTEADVADMLKSIYELHQRRIKDKLDFKEIATGLQELGVA